jgi:hypothetical protein
MIKIPRQYGYREAEFSDITFLSIKSYSEHPEVYKAAELLFKAFKDSRKQIRNEARYLRDTRKLIASIWMHSKDKFRFTTKDTYFSKAGRKQVWMTNRILDLFNCAIDLNWILLIKAGIPPYASKSKLKTKSGEKKGLASIYKKNLKFKRLLKHLTEKDISTNPDIPCVVRHDADKGDIEEDEIFYQSKKYLNEKGLIDRHCERLIRFKASWADGRLIAPQGFTLQRIFNEDFSHGGRYYCGFQSAPKGLRNLIRIDNKAVVSLDIAQCHPMLILRKYIGKSSEDGLFNHLNEDVYQVNGFNFFPREIRKKLVNTLFNSKTEGSAVKAYRSTHWWRNEFTNDIEIETYNTNKKRKGVAVFPNGNEIVKFIEGFKFSHPDFTDFIGTGVGSELMGFDGHITHFVLKLADKYDLPIIPIHEEYIVPKNKKDLLKKIFKEAVGLALKNDGKYGEVQIKWTDSRGKKTSEKLNLFNTKGIF